MTLPFLAACLGGTTVQAHPHIFVEANVEIIRDAAGSLSRLRHVWRFDEFFSSTVLLDYDIDANGEMSVAELDDVSAHVTKAISEYDFFTRVRLDRKDMPFRGPERIMVDFVDGQVLMFFELAFDRPVAFDARELKIAVADPTYYIAMEIADEAAVQITGAGTECRVAIERPDFDKLYAQNQMTLTEEFFADPENASLGDEWMTWLDLRCE